MKKAFLIFGVLLLVACSRFTTVDSPRQINRTIGDVAKVPMNVGTKLNVAFPIVNLAIDQVNTNTANIALKAPINNTSLTGLTLLEQLKISSGGTTITAITSDGSNIHFWSGATELAAVPGIGGAVWGQLTGSMGSQNDLTSALNAKSDLSTTMTTSHAANVITSTDLTHYGLAYSWGNHASAGYASNSSLANYALNSALAGYVPTTRTVNGHPLSSNFSITTTDLSLNLVDNTSDVNKPISTATGTALSGKQATLVSGVNLSTVGGHSLLDGTDIAIAGSGTVTSVGVTTANGVSASVANSTTAPNATFTLGAITPSSVAAVGTVTGSNLSNTNTGDNATNTQYSGLVTNATHTGDATGSQGLTVVKINGTLLSGLATGLLKNTTGTGVPSIASPGTDYVVPSGSITGNAATATKLAATKTINGIAFDGSTNITVPDNIAPGASGNVKTSNGSVWTSAAPAAPASHAHGNITNAGAIGSTATLPVITTTSGVLVAGSFGTSAGTFTQGNDSRFTYVDFTSSGQTQLNNKTQIDWFISASNATAKETVIADAVCDGTADEVQINAALTAGYNVRLSSGTFTIAAPITYAATNLTITGAGTDKTIIARKAAAPDFAGIVIGGNGWTLKDFTIDGNSGSATGTSSSFGVSATAMDYLSFKNVKFTDMGVACVGLKAGCDYISFDNCLFKDSWQNGIEDVAGNVNHVKITNCNFVSVDYTPIYTDVTALSVDWVLDNCSFYDAGYRVKFVNASYVKVSNCHFDAVGGGTPSATNGSISFEETNNCSISNSTIINSLGVGLELRGVTNQDVTDVDIYNSGGIPISINQSSYNTINNSNVNIIGGHIGTATIDYLVFIGSGTNTAINFNGTHFQTAVYGIRFDANSVNCSVVNCQFNDLSGRAITTSFNDGDANNLKVQNNTFITCGIGLEYGDGDDAVITGNKFISCTTPIDISDARAVRTFIDGNNWYGCTNNPASTGATTPKWGLNIDKDGVDQLTSPKINEDVAMTRTSTQLNLVDATSSIQGQLDAKINADYVIRKISSTYYAYPANGYTAYSGTNFTTVLTSATGQLTSGGVVFLDFVLADAIDLYAVNNAKVTIQGRGKYLTKLKLKANADAAGGFTWTGVVQCIGYDNFTIKDLEIDGNGANQTLIDNNSGATNARLFGVRIGYTGSTTNYATVENIYVHDCTVNGIQFHTSNNGVIKYCRAENNGWNDISQNNGTNIVVEHNQTGGAGDKGISISGIDISVDHNFIGNVNGLHGSSGNGWGVEIGITGENPVRVAITDNFITGADLTRGLSNNGTPVDCKISGNMFYDITTTDAPALSLGGALRTTITNNKFIRCGGAAISLTAGANYSMISGNDISEEGTRGIDIGASSYNNFIGNTLRGVKSVRLDATSNYNTFTGNIYESSGSTAYDFANAGTGNVSIGNIGLNADGSARMILEEVYLNNRKTTATSDGTGTGILREGSINTTITSSSAAYIVCLPAASASTIGTKITGNVIANGFELRVQAAQATTVYVNGVTTNVEAAIPANSSFEVVCIDATHWILKAWTATGDVLVIVPDAV